MLPASFLFYIYIVFATLLSNPKFLCKRNFPTAKQKAELPACIHRIYYTQLMTSCQPFFTSSGRTENTLWELSVVMNHQECSLLVYTKLISSCSHLINELPQYLCIGCRHCMEQINCSRMQLIQHRL